MNSDERNGNATDPNSETREDDADGPDDSDGVDWGQLSVVGALGAELAGFLIVGLLGGNYLDGELGTSPLFLLIGLVVALAAAGLQLWRLTLKVGSGDDR